MNRDFLRKLIIYEIYPTSFCDSNADGIGDLQGIISKLDYIQKTGFNAIWLNPFYKSPFRDGGYDVADFFAVDERFGTLEDFTKLITEAHKRDIRVILDLIPGHASLDNPDFLQSAKAERNDRSDLFIWNDNPWAAKDKLLSGFFERHGAYMVNFFAHQPAFNYGFNRIEEPSWQLSYQDERTYQARNYLLQVMRFWLNRGADGFRVDMADSLVKNDDGHKATIEVWQYLFSQIRKEFPAAFFISEWSDPKQAFAAGFEADFVLDHWDNFYHRFFRSGGYSRGTSIINGGGDTAFALHDLKERFEEAEKYHAFLSLISGNHDTWRIANYLNDEQLKMFYMFIFALPGIPCILYGDEIAMKSADLPCKDGGYQRTGTRIPMIFDDSEPFHGFTAAKQAYLPFNPKNTLCLKKAQDDENSLYNFIRKLIKLRTEIADLSDPHLEVKEDKRVFSFIRNEYELLMNMSAERYPIKGEIICSSVPINDSLPPGTAVLIRKSCHK